MSRDIKTINSFNSLFVIGFALINCVGILLSSKLSLPVWLDSVGTMLSVYFFGVYAGLVCVLVNIATQFLLDSLNFVSPAVGVFIIYATHFFKNKHRIDLNAMMLFSIFVIFFSFLISCGLNFFYEGQIRANLWGDAILSFCRDNNIKYAGLPLAVFYLEFLDKLVCVLIFFLLTRFVLLRLSYFKTEDDNNESSEGFTQVNLIPLVIGVSVFSLFSYPSETVASETAVTDMAKSPLHDLLSYSVQETVYNQKNGLPSGNVTSICSTSDGYVWIGSYSGLLKYDGNNFKKEKGFERVRNIKTMHAQGNRLWIGTTDLGVYLLENGKIVNHLTVKDDLLSDYVSGIESDDKGNIYISTPSGMNILNNKDGSYRVNSVYRAGNFSYLSHGQEYILAVDLKGVIHCFYDTEEVIKITPPEHVHYTSALYCENGFLYAADSSGKITRYKKKDNSFVKVDDLYNRKLHGVESMFYSSIGDKRNTVFICSDSGIFYLQRNSIKKIQTDSFNDSIDQGIRDFQGNLWFSSSRLGLLRLYIPPVVMVPALKNQVVNCITKWRDHYIVGTDAGLKAYTSNFSDPISYDFTNLLTGIRIRDVYVDRNDYLWICTHGNGVYRIKDTIQHFTEENGLFGNKARSVLEIDDSRVMLSGTSGLSFFDKNSGIIQTENILQKNVTVLCSALGYEGEIYAGTNGNGIYVINDYKLEKIITKKDGLNSNTILRLYSLDDKKGLIAVTGNGLCYIDENYEVRELKNFPFFNNYDIIKIGTDKVAVTGSNGVYIVSLTDLIADNPDYPTEHLDESYGFIEILTANSRNYLDDKILFLSSNAGAFAMNIDNYQHKNNIFKLQIGSIKVDGEVYESSPEKKLVFPRSSKRLTIQPAVLNFTPENPYVGICLEGVDDGFTYTRQKDLTDVNYTNLGPGDYVYTMALFNSDFERRSDILRMPFTKASAFYDSKLFITYFILVSSLIIVYFTFFIVKLWMQKVIDEKQLQLELAEQQIKMGDETILTIAQALDARDPRTKSHSMRVAEYSVMIAKQLGFTPKQCENLRKVALLHDIGKIGIPDRILNKPERLTDEEYRIMQSHVTIGAEILKNFKSIDNLADGIKYHHERYDGKGYVLGVKGEEIPLIGRIISVADAFDAMSANRVYRDSLDLERVIHEIEKGRGSQFDPKCADIMLDLIRSGKLDDYLYNSL